MSLNVIRENKILAKISGFTVVDTLLLLHCSSQRHLLGKGRPCVSLVYDVFLYIFSLSHMVSWVRFGT